MSNTLDRPHVWQPGDADSGTTPLLLLHGTGGDENDLLPLREHLAPGAPMLSVRGAVTENGMPRFFRRVREGVFDEDDLRARVDELAEFLTAAETEYGVRSGSWRAVGLSNGANIAAAMLLRRPAALSGAALLAAMVPFRQPPGAELPGTRVAVVNGSHDPIATPWQTESLTNQLRAAGANVTRLDHAGGHTIETRLLPRVARFLREGDQ